MFQTRVLRTLHGRLGLSGQFGCGFVGCVDDSCGCARRLLRLGVEHRLGLAQQTLGLRLGFADDPFGIGEGSFAAFLSSCSCGLQHLSDLDTEPGSQLFFGRLRSLGRCLLGLGDGLFGPLADLIGSPGGLVSLAHCLAKPRPHLGFTLLRVPECLGNGPQIPLDLGLVIAPATGVERLAPNLAGLDCGCL